LAGYLQLGSKMAENPVKYAEAWNFGPYQEDSNLSVQDLAEIALSVWGSGSLETASPGHQPHEAGLLRLDIGKTTAELAWKPKMNARQAIGMTIEWYRETGHTSADKLVENNILKYNSL
jgi:CDP-glucose 4,6-dehydratase